MVCLNSANLEQFEINPLDLVSIRKTSLLIHKKTIEIIHKANSGHPGGSLSCIDILVALYKKFLKYNAQDPNWKDRDFFILSKGHAAPALYATLAHFGYFSEDLLFTLRKFGSQLQGHPKKDLLPGIECSTGALGIGLSIGVGIGLSLRLDQKSNKVYVLLGDGECQEGSIWEAVMSASHYRLDNLIAIVDRNGLQIDGSTEKIMGLEPFAAKWEKFGWNVIEIDGTDIRQIFNAFHTAQLLAGKPTVIIAYVVKGHGTSVLEHLTKSHGTPPTEEEFSQIIVHINNQEKMLEQEYLEELKKRNLCETNSENP